MPTTAQKLVPPTGAEQSHESPGESQFDAQDDALSDARRVFNQVDDARLVKLIKVWPALGDDVKAEILKLAGYDVDDLYDVTTEGTSAGEVVS